MKIHGLAYIFVGLFIGWFSYYVVNKAQINSTKFYIFFLAAGVFVFIGIAKLISGKKTINNTKQPLNHNIPNDSTANNIKMGIKNCIYCGARVHVQYPVCYRCGGKHFK